MRHRAACAANVCPRGPARAMAHTQAPCAQSHPSQPSLQPHPTPAPPTHPLIRHLKVARTMAPCRLVAGVGSLAPNNCVPTVLLPAACVLAAWRAVSELVSHCWAAQPAGPSCVTDILHDVCMRKRGPRTPQSGPWPQGRVVALCRVHACMHPHFGGRGAAAAHARRAPPHSRLQPGGGASRGLHVARRAMRRGAHTRMGWRVPWRLEQAVRGLSTGTAGGDAGCRSLCVQRDTLGEGRCEQPVEIDARPPGRRDPCP